MTNPFSTSAQPAAQPQPTPQPTFQPPVTGPTPGAQAFSQQAQQGAPAAGQFADPFGPTPDVPEDDDRLSKADAILGTVIILKVKSTEKYTSKFPVQGSNPPEYKEQTRLITDAIIVTGPKAGLSLADQWINWYSIVRQFQTKAGDGRPYLVQLYMDGNAVKAKPVQDPAIIQQAAQYLV